MPNRTKKKKDMQMIEGIMVLYKVTPMGGLQRNIQTDVNMGRKFFKSENGNMVLTRSKDKKILSLTNFDRYDENEQFFKIQAWTIKLKPYTTPDSFDKLHASLNRYFSLNMNNFDELVELSFIGQGKFVQLVYIETKTRDLVQQ
jgi:hypothetical protein